MHWAFKGALRCSWQDSWPESEEIPGSSQAAYANPAEFYMFSFVQLPSCHIIRAFSTPFSTKNYLPCNSGAAIIFLQVQTSTDLTKLVPQFFGSGPICFSFVPRSACAVLSALKINEGTTIMVSYNSGSTPLWLSLTKLWAKYFYTSHLASIDPQRQP